MDKAEILAKHVNTQFYSPKECEMIHDSTDIEEAMDEYAKQVAVDFANWINKHPLDFVSDAKGKWMGLNLEAKTSDELYNEYLKQCDTSSK